MAASRVGDPAWLRFALDLRRSAFCRRDARSWRFSAAFGVSHFFLNARNPRGPIQQAGRWN